MNPTPPTRGAARGSNGGNGHLTSGSVLQDVVIDPVPLTLRRPGAQAAQPVRVGEQPPGADAKTARPTSPAGDVNAGPTPPAKESISEYDQGFRAGFAAGEAAQRARAQDALATERRAALDQGLQEGRQQGLAEGREAARQAAEREVRAGQEEIAARLAQLDRLLASLPGELTRRLEGAEDDMVALCHAAVCRVLGDELVTVEGIAHLVRQAVRESGPSALGSGRLQLAILVHPKDLAAYERDPDLAAWMRQHASAGAVQWIGDERVRLGGCLVRTAEGTLDARLETQLAALQRVFTEGRAGAPEPAQAAPDRPGGGRET